ncbi:MAG: phage baseplate assembly protein V [Mesorhizobium sp.]
MSDLEDVIRRIVDQMLSRQPHSRIGTVTSYDPNRHAAKVMLQPENVESGWVPISTAHVGNGFGLAIGLTPGDQVEIGYFESNPDAPRITGRVHSDQERPPVAQSGEIVLQTPGATIKVDASSNISISTTGNLTISATGNVAIASATLKHNGVNIGSTHVHSGVTPGAADTGVPQ